MTKLRSNLLAALLARRHRAVAARLQERRRLVAVLYTARGTCDLTILALARVVLAVYHVTCRVHFVTDNVRRGARTR